MDQACVMRLWYAPGITFMLGAAGCILARGEKTISLNLYNPNGIRFNVFRPFASKFTESCALEKHFFNYPVSTVLIVPTMWLGL